MGQEEIRKDLVIKGPVAYIIKDEYGVDFEIIRKVCVGAIGLFCVDWLGERRELVVVALLRFLDKGKYLRVGLPDVAGSDNALEPVAWG